jgi:hypothetical protein
MSLKNCLTCRDTGIPWGIQTVEEGATRHHSKRLPPGEENLENKKFYNENLFLILYEFKGKIVVNFGISKIFPKNDLFS